MEEEKKSKKGRGCQRVAQVAGFPNQRPTKPKQGVFTSQPNPYPKKKYNRGVKIEVEEFASLCKQFFTRQQIAEYYNISMTTLYNWCQKTFNLSFEQAAAQFSARSQFAIKRSMFQTVEIFNEYLDEARQKKIEAKQNGEPYIPPPEIVPVNQGLTAAMFLGKNYCGMRSEPKDDITTGGTGDIEVELKINVVEGAKI